MFRLTWIFAAILSFFGSFCLGSLFTLYVLETTLSAGDQAQRDLSICESEMKMLLNGVTAE